MTTTGSPPSWRIWSRPTRWCCSPTWTRSTTAPRAAPAPAGSRRCARSRPGRCRDQGGRQPGRHAAGWRPRSRRPRSPPAAGIPVAAHRDRAGVGAPWRARMSGRSSVPGNGARRAGCCGWRTPPLRRVGCMLDEGAVHAVVVRRKSLLPAGIVEVRGRSSPATRSTWSTRPAGRSPAAWSTTPPRSCPPLLGRCTARPGPELGPEYEREVVHRDDHRDPRARRGGRAPTLDVMADPIDPAVIAHVADLAGRRQDRRAPACHRAPRRQGRRAARDGRRARRRRCPRSWRPTPTDLARGPAGHAGAPARPPDARRPPGAPDRRRACGRLPACPTRSARWSGLDAANGLQLRQVRVPWASSA